MFETDDDDEEEDESDDGEEVIKAAQLKQKPVSAVDFIL
jgi:hypothetical protein